MSVVRTAIPYPNHRSAPLAGIRPFVEMLDQSGVVDQFWVWDELTGWAPEGFGVPPGMEAPDPHSTHDPFIECAFAVAASGRIGVRMTTDSVRSRPAELTRMLLSLASATEGKVTVAIGSGEARHIKPYGYKPGEGIARMEDIFRLSRKLLTADRPFSFEGNHWNFRNAYVGRIRPRLPEFWALGGGPKLVDIVAQYGDGIEGGVPSAVANLEVFEQQVHTVRQRVEAFGRDPNAFGFGIWLTVGLHEDRKVLEQAMGAATVKWFSASYGRFDQSLWAKEGIQSAFPSDYHYGRNFLPFNMTAQYADEIAARVSPALVEKAAFWGTPEEAAAFGRKFIDAGATFVGVLDVLPLGLGPQAWPDSIRRSIDVCRLLKQ